MQSLRYNRDEIRWARRRQGCDLGRGSVTGVEPTDDSVDTIADALLVVSRLLVAISARSIAGVDHTLTIPQFRALVIMSNVGPVKLTSLARLLGLPPDLVAPM